MAHRDGTDELVVRARDGDGDAWARLVERHSGLLWSIARSHGLNDADSGDVVQTTWLRLVERIDGLREPAATACWLATTARNECLRLLRGAAGSCGGARAARARARPRPGRRGARAARPGRRGAGGAAAAVPHAAAAVRARADARRAGRRPRHPLGSVGPTRARCVEALRRLVP